MYQYSNYIYLSKLCYPCLQKVNVLSDDQWPSVLAEYIRHNDEAMLKASERVLSSYRDELLPCTSFEEFCDIVGKFWKSKKLKSSQTKGISV